MENINLGEQIALCRKARGMTQEALASALGVTNQAVSKWESNTCCPDVQLLPRLADLFEISLDQLFGREVKAPVPVVEGLPWADDGQLRAVLYMGNKLQTHRLFDRHSREKARMEFHYDGPALHVTSDFSVTCRDVAGDVHAGDGVQCGNVGGNVQAGDSISCGDVQGSVRAGDSVTCTNVLHGDVHAGDSVHCGDIHGDATAGDSVRCSHVAGNIRHR